MLQTKKPVFRLLVLLLTFLLLTGCSQNPDGMPSEKELKNLADSVNYAELFQDYDIAFVWIDHYLNYECLSDWGTENEHKLRWLISTNGFEPVSTGASLMEDDTYTELLLSGILKTVASDKDDLPSELFRSALEQLSGCRLKAMGSSAPDSDATESYIGTDTLVGIFHLEMLALEELRETQASFLNNKVSGSDFYRAFILMHGLKIAEYDYLKQITASLPGYPEALDAELTKLCDMTITSPEKAMEFENPAGDTIPFDERFQLEEVK